MTPVQQPLMASATLTNETESGGCEGEIHKEDPVEEKRSEKEIKPKDREVKEVIEKVETLKIVPTPGPWDRIKRVERKTTNRGYRVVDEGGKDGRGLGDYS